MYVLGPLRVVGRRIAGFTIQVFQVWIVSFRDSGVP